MENIRGQSHDYKTFIYSVSRLTERAGYYGLRALLILYLTGEVLHMSAAEALEIIGWFASSVLVSQVVGAVMGDLVFGNKRAFLLGGVLQALGAFSFCIPSVTGVYVGIFLIVIGNGLYTPNLLAHFGKQYLDKKKLLDAAFTLFFLAVNIGSFLGVVLLGRLGDGYGYNLGFIAAGLLLLLSVLFPAMTKETRHPIENDTPISITRRAIFIVVAIFLVGVYRIVCEIANSQYLLLELKFKNLPTLSISEDFWHLAQVNFKILIVVSILAVIIWTKFYSSTLIKLLYGFFFCAASLGVLIFVPEAPVEHHIYLYLLSLICFGIAEICIAPVIYSMLTKYSNPKYLAIMMSLVSVFLGMFIGFAGLFNEHLYDGSAFSITLAAVTMVFVFFILLVGILFGKRRYLAE